MFRRILGAMVTIAAFSVLAAPVQAQTNPPYVRFESDAVSDPVAPETDLAQFHVQLTVGCHAYDYQGNKATEVSYKPINGLPGMASAVIQPTHDSFTFGPQACATSNYTHPFKATLSVSFNRTAAAFTDYKFGVEALIKKPGVDGTTTSYGPYQVEMVAKPGFVALTQVTPGTYFIKTAPNTKATFPFDIYNLGNGPARVKVMVTQPNQLKLDSVLAPADLHLESKATNGASAAYHLATKIDAQTPHSNGYTNSIYSFVVKFTTEYDGDAADRTATDEAAVTLSVQVQGTSGGALGDVPGVSGTWLLSLLALAALGLSRRGHA